MAADGSMSRLMGVRVPRVEDARLLRGQGRFVGDIVLTGMLHAHFLRSPLAHARLKRIDTSEAKRVPGVRAVLAWADLRPLLTRDRIPLSIPSGAAVCLDRGRAPEDRLNKLGECPKRKPEAR